jgi:hypothetical protein
MATIYTFDANNIPTDPQILAVYNGLNRAQRATYDNLTNAWERSIFLNGIAEEKRKSVYLLRWCTLAFELFTEICYK